MKKNNFGFTLIEVLAAVVILGIISSTAIIGYNSYIKKAKNNYYKTQEDMMIEAGRDYFTDNRGRLPQTAGQESCVLLKTLTHFNYIKPILDYNKKSCSDDKSKVCVTRITNRKYIYTSYLNCGTAYSAPANYDIPEINYIYNPKNKQNIENKPLNITMKIGYKSDAENKTNIASYRYVIHKKLDDGTDLIYYDTGWKENKNNKTSLDVNIKLDSAGKFYVVGYAYNVKGKFVQKKSENVSLTYKLDCNSDISFTPNGKDWTNQDISTTITTKGGVFKYDVSVKKSTDSSPTLIKNNIYTKDYKNVIKNEGQWQYVVTAYDDRGNSCQKESKVYKIDKTKPTCAITESGGTKGNGWDNNNPSQIGWYKNGTTKTNPVNLTAKCSDNGGSQCKKNATGTYYTNTNETKTLTVYDNAGNKGTCSRVVKIDVNAPEIPQLAMSQTTNCKSPNNYYSTNSNTYKNNTWTNKNVAVSAKDTSDNGPSGFDHFEYTTSGATTKETDIQKRTRYVCAEGTSRIKFRACDKAGNCSGYSNPNQAGIIKIDKTKPTCNYTSDYLKWTNQNREVSKWCTDKGGSGCTSDTKISRTVNETMKTTTLQAFDISDNAGNKVSCPKRTIKVLVDKTKPTCNYTSDYLKWTNQNREVSKWCTDKGGSGCTSDTKISRTVNETMKTTTLQAFNISDNAGNKVSCPKRTINVLVDKTRPDISSLTASDKTITIKAKDSNSGISAYCVSLGKANCTAYSSKNVWHGITTTENLSKKYTTSSGNGTYYVSVKDVAGNISYVKSVKVDSTPTLSKLENWDKRYCTFHNGGASSAGGSSIYGCSDEVTGTNCWTKGYNTNNHRDQTYANMKLTSISGKISGSDYEVTLKITIGNGYWGTYISGNNRYMCLKKNNRKFSNACSTDSIKITPSWGGNGGTHEISKKFIIKNYKGNLGKYSFKMYGPNPDRCADAGNVNNINYIYSFQTDYIFELK